MSVDKKAELADLCGRIEKWSEQLGLDTNSNVLFQVEKQFEEFGELAKFLQKKDTLEIMDGLGDVAVVACVMASMLRKFSVNDNYRNMPLVGIGNEYSAEVPTHPASDEALLFYRVMQDLTRYITYCHDSELQGSHGHYLFMFGGKLLTSLNKLAKCLNLEFNECVKMAYSTIHFRSGKIENGIFVKVVPDNFIEIPVKKLQKDIDSLLQEIVEYAQENKIEFFKVKFNLSSDVITHYKVD